MLEGLSDAAMLWTSVAHLPAGLFLHGHLHKRVRRRDRTDSGGVYSIGATSASLHHDSSERMASFNVYDVATDGTIGAMEAHVLTPGGHFDVHPFPLL